MDARALLKTVGEVYAKLSSFEAEILLTTESGSEDDFNRNARRARAFFVAPDKLRIEQSGRHGMLMVCDGVEVQRYHPRPGHYFSSPVEPGHRFEGFFHAEHPFASGMTFLFDKIAENAASAEMVEESVVSVIYDPAKRPSFVVASSPVKFWIDQRTMLVSRMEGEVTHRFPAHEEEVSSKSSFVYSHAFVDQEIPPRTFEYAPPEGAVDASMMPPRAGSGTSRPEPDGYKTWHYANWEGEAFVDRFELKIRNMEFEFERRLTFGEKQVDVAEKILGPLGPTERGFSIRAAE
jgi:outer membrane lipoprotein-sorting protein